MRTPNPGEILWSEALVARLSELWMSGTTSGEIGRRLGISRSSVMGKLRRLGLLCNDHRALLPRRVNIQLSTDFSTVTNRPQKRPHSRNKRPVTDFVIPPPPPPPPAYGTLNLLDLRHNSCRWPEGERPDYRFCGRPKAGESSYCESHRVRSLSGGPGRPAQYFNLSIRAAG